MSDCSTERELLRFLEHRGRGGGLGEPRLGLCSNPARIDAQGTIVAGTEAHKKGLEAVALVGRYQDHAVMLVREALKRTPADRRAAFWRDSIQADPALSTLRRRIASPELAGPVPSGGAKGDRRGP
jgi:hypothetical protein